MGFAVRGLCEDEPQASLLLESSGFWAHRATNTLNRQGFGARCSMAPAGRNHLPNQTLIRPVLGWVHASGAGGFGVSGSGFQGSRI